MTEEKKGKKRFSSVRCRELLGLTSAQKKIPKKNAIKTTFPPVLGLAKEGRTTYSGGFQ